MLGLFGEHAAAAQAVIDQEWYAAGQRAAWFIKAAGDAVPVYALKGRLYLTRDNWLVMDIPSQLVRGLFDALALPGIELPIRDDKLMAHVAVMSPAEVEKIGPKRLSERGQSYSYNIGQVHELSPRDWPGISKAWAAVVTSPPLKTLRKSYGLSPLPNDQDFCCTIAVRKTGILGPNNVSKAAAVHDSVEDAAAATATPLSQAQREAGNYTKGKFRWNGLLITIEIPKGKERTGVDKNGKAWSQTMKSHYGYFSRQAPGADGEAVDVFVGPDLDSDKVFVVNQVKPDGKFDEHKVVIGHKTEAAARKGYLENYSKDWNGLGSIKEMELDDFKEWLKNEDKSSRLKAASRITTHTHTDATGTYDFSKLFELLNGRPSEPIDLASLGPMNRSPRTGFSHRRYAETDPSFPILVNQEGQLLDGRHRVSKLLDSGATHTQAVRVTPEDMSRVKLDDTVPAQTGPDGTTNPGAIAAAETANASEPATIKSSADEALGIPTRKNYGDLTKLTPGELLTYVTQAHDATRAGMHTDIRFGRPDTGLFSFASRKGVPTPGETHHAARQPLHRHRYAKFEGTIPRGQYGAGTVKTLDKGEALLTAVTDNRIELTLAHRKHPERMSFTRPSGWGRDFLLRNDTPTAGLPYQKIRHTSVSHEDVPKLLESLPPETAIQPKVDGASSLIQLTHRGPELFSYRTQAENPGRPIVHSERFFGNRPRYDIPKHLHGSVLRGELYGVQNAGGEEHAGVSRLSDDRGHGTVIPPQQLGALLNSTLANSLRKQKETGTSLKAMLFDIQRHGKHPVDLATTPYAERRKMLEEIIPHLPADKFHLAPQVHGAEEGKKLWDEIRSGRHPMTHEGIVAHPPTGKPIKGKITDEHDVQITGTFPGQGRRAQTVGGLTYAHPDEPDKTVGRVGSGLTEETLQDIARDPSGFIGRIARLKAQERLPSGALRAPVFLALHEDYPSRKG